MAFSFAKVESLQKLNASETSPQVHLRLPTVGKRLCRGTAGEPMAMVSSGKTSWHGILPQVSPEFWIAAEIKRLDKHRQTKRGHKSCKMKNPSFLPVMHKKKESKESVAMRWQTEKRGVQTTWFRLGSKWTTKLLCVHHLVPKLGGPKLGGQLSEWLLLRLLRRQRMGDGLLMELQQGISVEVIHCHTLLPGGICWPTRLSRWQLFPRNVQKPNASCCPTWACPQKKHEIRLSSNIHARPKKCHWLYRFICLRPFVLVLLKHFCEGIRSASDRLSFLPSSPNTGNSAMALGCVLTMGKKPWKMYWVMTEKPVVVV